MTAVAQTRDRWRTGVEARALVLLTAVLLASARIWLKHYASTT